VTLCYLFSRRHPLGDHRATDWQRAHQDLAPQSSALGEEDEGAEALVATLNNLPEDRPTLTQLSECLSRTYQDGHSRAELEEVELLADGLNNRAVSLLDLDRENEAEQMLDAVLQTRPAHLQATYNRGVSRWGRGAITDTALLTQLSEMCQIHASHWEAPYCSGLIHSQRMDFASALKCFEQAIALGGTREVCSRLEQVRSVASRAPGHRMTMTGHTGDVTTLCFSGNSRSCLSASKDGTIRLWDVADGHCLRVFAGHEGSVTCACLSADGERVLSGGTDGTLRLWEAGTGNLVMALKNAGDIKCLGSA
jgi:WD40 repeat protein